MFSGEYRNVNILYRYWAWAQMFLFTCWHRHIRLCVHLASVWIWWYVLTHKWSCAMPCVFADQWTTAWRSVEASDRGHPLASCQHHQSRRPKVVPPAWTWMGRRQYLSNTWAETFEKAVGCICFNALWNNTFSSSLPLFMCRLSLSRRNNYFISITIGNGAGSSWLPNTMCSKDTQ